MRSMLPPLFKLFIFTLTIAGLGSATAYAAEESCASCDRKVGFSGDFVYQRAPGRGAIDDAPAGTQDSYREGTFGSNFTASEEIRRNVDFKVVP